IAGRSAAIQLKTRASPRTGFPPRAKSRFIRGVALVRTGWQRGGQARVSPRLVDGVAPETLEVAAPGGITFVTEGAGFAPVLTTRGPARVECLWSDGTHSSSLRPTRVFGTNAPRRHRLRVEPWSAVLRINIGHNGGDGGDPSIERVTDQSVSAVLGLEIVAPHLEHWCSSYNQPTVLGFCHFHRLRVIECYHSKSLMLVTLRDTPNLQRACLEDVGLTSLDLSESHALMDLRGALASFPDIAFGETGANLWHLCIRDNPQLTNQALFSEGNRFSNIAELFAASSNQRGTLAIHSTHPDRDVGISAANNAYEAVDFSGALQSPLGWAAVDISDNVVSHLAVTGLEVARRW
ncbi:MAG: hypothetical protein JW751_19390, partial [Polyangiaceae bacterium]|nr:hypothetical protein [Polyangiaceae bacterium]